MSRAIFYSHRVRDNLILHLEGMLCVILFRLGIFDTMYFAKNFILEGGAIVNKKIVKNPYYRVSLLDDISVSKKFFRKIFHQFWIKLREGSIFVNMPNYIAYNYRILHFSF